jgi:hypothetical protein
LPVLITEVVYYVKGAYVTTMAMMQCLLALYMKGNKNSNNEIRTRVPLLALTSENFLANSVSINSELFKEPISAYILNSPVTMEGKTFHKSDTFSLKSAWGK